MLVYMCIDNVRDFNHAIVALQTGGVAGQMEHPHIATGATNRHMSLCPYGRHLALQTTKGRRDQEYELAASLDECVGHIIGVVIKSMLEKAN